jgi:hypothetical protein
MQRDPADQHLASQPMLDHSDDRENPQAWPRMCGWFGESALPT